MTVHGVLLDYDYNRQQWKRCLDFEKKINCRRCAFDCKVCFVINVTRNKEANVVGQLAARDTPTQRQRYSHKV